jgi:hypothetical protein
MKKKKTVGRLQPSLQTAEDGTLEIYKKGKKE